MLDECDASGLVYIFDQSEEKCIPSEDESVSKTILN